MPRSCAVPTNRLLREPSCDQLLAALKEGDMTIILHLDPAQKRVIEDLFLTSARAPSIGLSSPTLDEDAGAIYRIAKEFSPREETEEARAVDIQDVLRMLRFVGWWLAYQDGPTERTRHLRRFFATVVLQAQAQNPGFESMLRAFGIEHQLEMQMAMRGARPASGRRPEAGSRLRMNQTHRTKHVHIRVNASGGEMVSTTTESTWDADGWKQTIR